MHDVGKIGVDDRVLKKPGKLTDEEFDLMKQHPTKGANIMRPVAQLKDMLPGIELHHERMDGAGYPYGLVGDQIPDDGPHHRRSRHLRRHHHQSPLSIRHGPQFAVERIRSLAIVKFDPQVVKSLEAAMPQAASA